MGQKFTHETAVMVCFHYTMAGPQLGRCKWLGSESNGWELESSRSFLTHMSDAWAKIFEVWAQLGIVDWRTHMWLLQLA